jgi:hypothetical protein
MLTRLIQSTAVAAATTMELLSLAQGPALAGGGPGNGGPFGSVQCGQSYSPTRAVSA